MISFIPLAVSGYLSFNNHRETIEKGTITHLTATTTLKEEEYIRWIKDKTQSLTALANHPGIRENVALLIGIGNELDPAARQRVLANIRNEYFLRSIEIEEDWLELFILQVSDGMIIVSSNTAQEGLFQENQPYFIEGQSHTYVQNIYYSFILEDAALTIGTPITDDAGNVIAVLGGRANLAELSEIMILASDVNDTEETYLVNKFNFFVTDSRFEPGYALNKSIYNEGINACLLHTNGNGLYNDYRDVPVITVYHWMPEQELCIMTQVDQTEAFEPVEKLISDLKTAGLVSSLIIITLALLVSQSITKPLKQLILGTEEIGSGNLDYKIEITNQDEIGQLADAFNNMTVKRKQSEKANNYKANLLENVTDAIISTDKYFNITSWNKAAIAIYGWEVDEVIGKSAHDFINPVYDNKPLEEVSEELITEGRWKGELLNERKDGTSFMALASVTSIFDRKNNLIGYVSISQDITEQNQAEKILQENKILFDRIPVGLYRTTPDGQILDINSAGVKLWGFPDKETALAANVKTVYVNDKDRERWKLILEREGVLRHHETNIKFHDGTTRWVKDTTRVIRNTAGEVLYYEGSFEDITERKQAEEKLTFMATHDALTELPNRELLHDRIGHAISIAKRSKDQLAVLFLDIDGFKELNDAYGHAQGDLVLQAITNRINDCVRDSDTLARFGGDEFSILLEGIMQMDDIFPIIEKIVQAIADPFVVQSSEVFITCSIGISLYPNDGITPEALIQNADRAMYHAKKNGKNNYHFYSASMGEKILEDMTLKNQLRHAITNDEFVLHYQPQVEITSGKIIGVEALLRWQHPTKGLLLPGDFINQAEKSGLIVPIGEWVLETACKQLQRWIEMDLPAFRISVNISRKELTKANLVEKIEKVLDKTGIPAERLELELSENIVFQDFDKSMFLLAKIKKLGVRLAIDDFGTGYSTLNQLAHFPFDTLKIDQRFSPYVTTSKKDAAIVRGIVSIAKNLELEVVVEGVETDEQLEAFQNMGCTNYQGWYFSRAVPVDEMERLLREGITISQLKG